MGKEEKMAEKVKKAMDNKEQIRNIGTVAHIDHGKTTTVDSLLAGCDMLSYEVAGEKLEMDTKEVEQERGITVESADVNMVHDYEGDEYLINLIDTPGHVDFGGDVTRAIRVIDGAVVLADAAEGVMPQTETVLQQSLKENVKPVLYINKTDRLISELKLGPKEIKERLLKIIKDVNELIETYAPDEFKEDWKVSVQDGSVVFGSAIDKWAISFPKMKKTEVDFNDIVEAYQNDDVEGLANKVPLHEVLLDVIVKHLPNPIEAQKYRIESIWRGDIDSEVGKALVNVDEEGPAVACVSKVVMDPHAGEIAISRLFSGELERGQEVHLIGGKKKSKVQQMFLWKGDKKTSVSRVPAGNIVGVVGLKGVNSGETVSEVKDITPFEQIKHIFEPVVTKAFEPKEPEELDSLIEALRNKSREDPTVTVDIDEETGENLVSGLGELHLEIVENDIREKGVEVQTSKPIVIYRETVTKESEEVQGKSPNSHNKFYITVEPLPEEITKMLSEGDIPEGKVKDSDEKVLEKLEDAGFSRDEAKNVVRITNDNIFMDNTKGIVHIGEVIDMCADAFDQVAEEGPLSREPCFGMLVKLNDTKLHEDAIHRGPAQVIPAVRGAIKQAMMSAGPLMYEPVQTVRIDLPTEYMGEVSKIIEGRRGELLNMEQKKNQLTVKAKLPVGEMFGFTDELRSETEGRGRWFLKDSEFEKLPANLQEEVISEIRKRKGLEALDDQVFESLG